MRMEMSLDVLLLSNADDFESALPTLESLTQTIRRVPLSDQLDGHHDSADVAIIDARTDLAVARSVCRGLTANTPAIAVVAVVAPAHFASVDVDWRLDDVMLPATGADELEERAGLGPTRGRARRTGRAHVLQLL